MPSPTAVLSAALVGAMAVLHLESELRTPDSAFVTGGRTLTMQAKPITRRGGESARQISASCPRRSLERNREQCNRHGSATARYTPMGHGLRTVNFGSKRGTGQCLVSGCEEAGPTEEKMEDDTTVLPLGLKTENVCCPLTATLEVLHAEPAQSIKPQLPDSPGREYGHRARDMPRSTLRNPRRVITFAAFPSCCFDIQVMTAKACTNNVRRLLRTHRCSCEH
ncbi:hypothetical protein B0T25DRAFT_204682 [Lasiosphaeria hispida]|uniref:Secreted protein n=1 Tax=Lasiosphaeria hispida TaxID=260671 RepID=A0AAJ0HIS1_9PEZI|nr:hypothetical protein B0T25DRAFT_204682 [Lasiosphaeria hispida]